MSSSANPKIKVEDEQENLYNIFNLSPNSILNTNPNAYSSLDSSISNVNMAVTSPPPAPTSNDMHVLPDNSSSLLSTNFGIESTNSLSVNTSQFLNPNSPGNQSSHSLYSDYSSNPASPFYDAVSVTSHNAGNSPGFAPYNGGVNINLGANQGYLDSNFDNEISLGGSVSSVNLVNLGQQQQQQQQQQQPLQPLFNNGVNMDPYQYDQINQLVQAQLGEGVQPQQYNDMDMTNHDQKNMYYDVHQLEEMKKINSNFENHPTIIYPNNNDLNVAHKTPSLFSNSSHNSSVYNDNVENGTSSLLTPEELLIRRGRKRSELRSKSKSRSRSNSGEFDDEDLEQPENVISTREKMLELASPNQVSKRTQKHPSAYACHLCDKRFTRPYNLKSHLRTHTDERPFICSMCGKAFARQHDRKRHEDLHSGEKKFQCKGVLKDGTPYGCGRRFARADALRRHFQTEAGKACIKTLMEEEEQDRINGGNPGSAHSMDSTYLTTNSSSIPLLAISPPEP